MDFYREMILGLDDIEAMRRLIEQGADVNATDGDMSLVRFAVSTYRAEALEFLLENGAEPSLELPDEDGWRPLHIACAQDTLSCVPALLAAGADVNAKTNNGSSALFVLAGRLDLKRSACVAKDLLKCGADASEPTEKRHSPLLAAILRNNRDLVKVLLRAGAEPVDLRSPTRAAYCHLLDGVRAAGDWKQWCSKPRRVLSGLVAKLAPRPGKPGAQRAGRARRAAVARPFPLDAASHVVSFLCPEGGY